MLLFLVKWLWCVNPYLLYVFSVMLFIIAGNGIRIIILMYCIISTRYDNITGHEIRLVFAGGTGVISIPRVLSLRMY